MATYPAEIVAIVEPFLLKDKKQLLAGERTHASDAAISRVLTPCREPSWNARDITAKARGGGLYSITQEAENWVIRWAVHADFIKWCEANPMATSEIAFASTSEEVEGCGDCGSIMAQVAGKPGFECLNCHATRGRS